MDVIILRGIPGSGKSTYADSVSDDDTTICSAYQYFTISGYYEFNPSLLRKAHNRCYDRFISAMEFGRKLTIVDNTNTRLWEFERYLDSAESYGAKVRVCRMVADVETCIRRQVHNVPADKILQMAGRFEDYPGEELIITKG